MKLEVFAWIFAQMISAVISYHNPILRMADEWLEAHVKNADMYREQNERQTADEREGLKNAEAAWRSCLAERASKDQCDEVFENTILVRAEPCTRLQYVRDLQDEIHRYDCSMGEWSQGECMLEITKKTNRLHAIEKSLYPWTKIHESVCTNNELPKNLCYQLLERLYAPALGNLQADQLITLAEQLSANIAQLIDNGKDRLENLVKLEQHWFSSQDLIGQLKYYHEQLAEQTDNPVAAKVKHERMQYMAQKLYPWLDVQDSCRQVYQFTDDVCYQLLGNFQKTPHQDLQPEELIMVTEVYMCMVSGRSEDDCQNESLRNKHQEL